MLYVNMKTLNDLAKVYKDKALQAINPGVPYPKYRKTGSSRAFKTGNLYRNVAQSNRINTMFTIDKRTGSMKFTFKFVVPDYAKYVQYGTKNMQARPFAQIAAESPEFRKAKDKLMNSKTSELLDGIFENLDRMWDAGGPELSHS